jgi:hypothetical protein
MRQLAQKITFGVAKTLIGPLQKLVFSVFDGNLTGRRNNKNGQKNKIKRATSFAEPVAQFEKRNNKIKPSCATTAFNTTNTVNS